MTVFLDTVGLLAVWDESDQWHIAAQECLLGIVDQVSFTVMRRLGVSKAFTNDQHYRAAGFEILF